MSVGGLLRRNITAELERDFGSFPADDETGEVENAFVQVVDLGRGGGGDAVVGFDADGFGLLAPIHGLEEFAQASFVGGDGGDASGLDDDGHVSDALELGALRDLAELRSFRLW